MLLNVTLRLLDIGAKESVENTDAFCCNCTPTINIYNNNNSNNNNNNSYSDNYNNADYISQPYIIINLTISVLVIFINIIVITTYKLKSRELLMSPSSWVLVSLSVCDLLKVLLLDSYNFCEIRYCYIPRRNSIDLLNYFLVLVMGNI